MPLNHLSKHRLFEFQTFEELQVGKIFRRKVGSFFDSCATLDILYSF